MSRIGSSVRFVWKLLLVVVLLAAAGVTALVVLDARARSDEEVRIIEVPYLGGSGALTTGRVIFVVDERAGDLDLMAHELVHACQWEEGQLEFLWDYASEYVSNLADLGDSDQAYREISFEEEARAGESECDLTKFAMPEE